MQTQGGTWLVLRLSLFYVGHLLIMVCATDSVRMRYFACSFFLLLLAFLHLSG